MPVQETQRDEGSGRYLEEKMASRCSILPWEVKWTEEPGGLQSVRSQRVGHNLVTEHARKTLKQMMY